MIFVTVGTHEQQFNRLVECVDELRGSGKIQEDVIIQTGFSTYQPKYCVWKKFIPYREMSEMIQKARIVITHGGPSSFIAPLQIGKIPIVVPRRKEFEEHVNDHQLYFCEEVAKRNRSIIVVKDMRNLERTIMEYDTLVEKMSNGLNSNNAKFCEEFEKIVNEMM